MKVMWLVLTGSYESIDNEIKNTFAFCFSYDEEIGCRVRSLIEMLNPHL